MNAPRWAARRNAILAGGTGAVLVALLMYPSSTSGRAPQATSAAGAALATVKAGADGLLVVDGPVVDTDYGPVQVQIKYREGRIELVTLLVYPRASLVDKIINDDAVKVLIGHTLIEQSAGIDTVTGATQTSTAYRTSLQAALDAAHSASPPTDNRPGHGGHSNQSTT